MYKTVLLNYWHERFENSILHAPEIFQHQQFAVDVPSGNCLQLVVSTKAVYHVPRDTLQRLEEEDIPNTKSIDIAFLTNINFDRERGIVVFEGRNSNSNSSLVTFRPILFFSICEAVEIVVEVQRVWEMVKQGSSELPFPCQCAT